MKIYTYEEEVPLREVFKAMSDMKVELINDGPVTIWIDSKNRE